MATLYVLRPITNEAKDWIKSYVNAPGYMKWGDAILVEHRFVDDIVGGMLNAGLKGGGDFTVRAAP
jgi:hypothetical protein